MGRGSLNASSEGIQKALAALQRQRMTQKALAEELQIARSTVSNFFAGKAIDRSIFIDKICHFLDLDWHEIVQYPDARNQQDRSSTPSQSDDALFQQVREHCRQKILNHHSRMRLLSGEEIGVDQLYVDVWLLNRPEHKLYTSPESLLKTFDVKNDRLALARRTGDRRPGFEVACKNKKLVILGKPGVGKTTFLKHLAVSWCKDKDGFQPDLVAVLVEFRRAQDEHWHILDAIDEELGLGNWRQVKELLSQITILKQAHEELLGELQQRREELQQAKLQQVHEEHIEDLQQQVEVLERQIKTLRQQIEALRQQIEASRQQVKEFLHQGKLLVLMDGLDEVPTNKLRRDVQNQLREIAESYPENRFILTCRTQIMESTLVGFTPVEVADFSANQVKQFVQNWFMASVQSSTKAKQQWKVFDNATNNNPALKELTVTPVLLNLMCLVFQDSGEIPSQVDWLYRKGIKLLLSKWNDTKAIGGWILGNETYQALNVEQKEALLIEIAACKFENPSNFVLFHQEEIVVYIARFLRLSNLNQGVAVLKAIEAQHGLLIERADELWSFSHLTFQEYFTLQWLTQLPSEQLAEKIAKEQWQEAVKQIVKSQQPADRLLRLIKQAIDQSIASEPKLQKFLTWILLKVESVQADHKAAATRFFYFELARNHARNLDPAPAFNRDCALDFSLDRALDRVLDLDRVLNLGALDFDFDRAFDLNRALILDLDRTLTLALDPKLVNALKQFKTALPVFSTRNWKRFQQWWQAHGIEWIEQLRQVMIEHRNIGHYWQFTSVQIQQLQHYYAVNKFLVELMQIEGAVSDIVRAEIEDGLLLPWEELQRCQS